MTSPLDLIALIQFVSANQARPQSTKHSVTKKFLSCNRPDIKKTECSTSAKASKRKQAKAQPLTLPTLFEGVNSKNLESKTLQILYHQACLKLNTSITFRSRHFSTLSFTNYGVKMVRQTSFEILTIAAHKHNKNKPTIHFLCATQTICKDKTLSDGLREKVKFSWQHS